jgi:hypothetical protein
LFQRVVLKKYSRRYPHSGSTIATPLVSGVADSRKDAKLPAFPASKGWPQPEAINRVLPFCPAVLLACLVAANGPSPVLRAIRPPAPSVSRQAGLFLSDDRVERHAASHIGPGARLATRAYRNKGFPRRQQAGARQHGFKLNHDMPKTVKKP